MSLLARVYLRLNIGAWGGYFCVAFVSYAFATWAPVLLTTAHFPIAFALKASLAFNLLAVIATMLAGPIVARVGSRRPLILCCVSILAALALLAGALCSDAAHDNAWLRAIVLLGSAGGGGSTGAATAIVYGLLTLGYPTALRARGLGVGLMLGRTGGIVTTLTGGALLTLDGTSSLPFFVALIGCGCLALVAAFVLDRHLVPGR